MTARIALMMVLLLTGLVQFAAAAEKQVVEVLTLGYRQADDVIPMLRPLLAPGGTITGMTNRLVVRTTRSNLDELKQVLAVVDTAPRRLMISVRQTMGQDDARDSASAGGTVVLGDTARADVPRRRSGGPGVSVETGRARVEGGVSSSRSARNEDVTQTLQVLEGNPALIRMGKSAVVPSTRVIETPGGTQVIQGGQIVEADTGFYVTPRVSGDYVRLEISTSRDRLRNPSTGTTHIQRVDTIVSGRLGEWIELGGSTQAVQHEQGEIFGRTRDARRDDRRILLKVDEIR